MIDQLPAITFVSFDEENEQKFDITISFNVKFVHYNLRVEIFSRQIDFNLFSPREISRAYLGCFDYTRKLFEAPTVDRCLCILSVILKLSAIFIGWKKIHPVNANVLLHRIFSNYVHVCSFFQHILTRFPYNALETVGFIKTFKFGNFKKIDGFFRKNSNFFEIADGGKFSADCVSDDSIS